MQVWLRKFLVLAPPGGGDGLRACIWSSNLEPVGDEQSYNYSLVVLEQSKIYIEMADGSVLAAGWPTSYSLL